ncbi:hypothetical protein [Falsiroseomonas oryziterrae]|uniref:hypothetical protein n=1 Tax=Falsiroseomonas oryziterrae TaxID=2911368 RepID=UPI001F1C2265|nr:hypothetical protein [Roseomonas sp. NPKOSM-4]
MDTNPDIRAGSPDGLSHSDARVHWSAWVALAVLVLAAAWFRSIDKGNAAGATLLGAAGCLALILPPRERMRALPWRVRAFPRHLDSLPVFATLLSAPGYGLNWFHGVNPYDEVVHLLSGALAGVALAALVGADGRSRRIDRMLRLGLAAGFAMSVVWEGFEWAVGIVGDWRDTWTDVALTTVGVVLACVLASRPSVVRADAGRDL